jgi:hypothetical protein
MNQRDAIPFHVITFTAPLGGFVLLHDELDVVLASDDPKLPTDRLP